MPNWTMNGLVCHEDDLKRILDPAGNVDFNRILPMPEELQIENGSITFLAEKYLAAFEANDGAAMRELEKQLPSGIRVNGEERDISTTGDLLEAGRLYRSNRERFGAPTWFEWSIENWGTKWNACHTEIADLGGAWRAVTFDTAWCPPGEELRAAMFDGFEHVFHMEAYDEDYDDIYCTNDFYTGDSLFPVPSIFQEISDDGNLTAMYAPSVTAGALDDLDAALMKDKVPEGLDLEAEAFDMREASGGLERGGGPVMGNER